MRTNTSEAKNSEVNEKKGTQRGHLAPVSPFPGTEETARKTARAAKSSVDYWKERVRPRVLKDGIETPEFYLRVKEGGRDAWICLHTANRADAARKARDLWLKIAAAGLDAVLAELRPDKRPEKSATVAELLAVAREVATVRASTLHQYEIALRRLVAGVLGMKAESSVYYAKSEAAKAWREKIDAARLDVLNDAKVDTWRKSYVDEAPDELARLRRKNTAAAVIRNARALLAPGMLKAYGERLRIPEPVPLAALAIGGTPRRFKTSVNPRDLFAAAKKELKGDALAALVLCLFAGLRRAEADMLPRAHLDLDAALIHVRPTAHFLPKTEESQRTTPLHAEAVKILRKHLAATPVDDMVLAGANAGATRGPKDYRCDCWHDLAAWLRGKGFQSPNPIHELRKLSGSLVNAAGGLEAARRHLGHRTVATTANSYVTGSAVTVKL